MGAVSLPAAVLNDGTSTENLARLQNEFGTDTASTTATVTENGTIAVAQSAQGFPLPPLRTAWYDTTQVPSGAVYSVSADFKPATDADERRGGVIAWLDKTSKIGLGLHLRPAGFSKGFRLNTINFAAETADENESLSQLFNLDGTPATADTTSAIGTLSDDYDAAQPATLELAFSEPSDAEKADLAEATAKITAIVRQSDGTTSQQLGEAIELLTTLPLPEPAAHRVGYYAYWGSIFAEGGSIGELDNLTVDGSFQDTPPNALPTVTLNAPSEGTDQLPPATFTLEMDATDTDGTVDLVEVFLVETGELLASFTEAPYSLSWENVNSGNYTLFARATDNCGASADSETLSLRSNRAPRAEITSPNPGAVFQLPITLSLTASVSDLDGDIASVQYVSNGTETLALLTEPPFSFDWADAVPGEITLTAIVTDNLGGTAESAPVQFTIEAAPTGGEPGGGEPGGGEPGTGTPAIPALAVSVDSGLVTLTWPTDSGDFTLESTTDFATWTAEAVQANPFLAIPTADASLRFYRLQPAN